MSSREEKTDLLGRQEFIDQLIHIVERLAANKKNACYAINGGWGVGKTFVLEKFENQLRSYEAESFSKYLIIHYNCWQYDYYEEPLIAIVAVLLDQIEEQTQLIKSEQKDKIVSLVKAVGLSLLGKVQNILQEKTNIDLEELKEIITNTAEVSQGKIEEIHKFDLYFDFKNILKKLAESIELLARDQTIVLVVDELDRCLPEYTIKILERLHHVFDEIPNVQVIIAVDKEQLDNIIKQIYGEKISTQRYLAKFIDFELKLEAGSVSDIVEKEYNEYYKQFKHSGSTSEAYTKILSGIDIRACKEIVAKSQLCHELLNPSEKTYDDAILAVEIFLTLLEEYGLKIQAAKDRFNSSCIFSRDQFTDVENRIFSSSQMLPGLILLSEECKKRKGIKYLDTLDTDPYVHVCDIWGLLLGCYRVVLGFEDQWGGAYYGDISVFRDLNIIEYTKEFWKLLGIIN